MKSSLLGLILLLSITTSNLLSDTEKYLISLSSDTKQLFFKNDTVVQNDSHILIKVPDFADNPTQVPVFIDASFYKNAKRLIVFADLNLIQSILDMKVIDFIPTISMNIKVAQSTPLRVAVLDDKNIWHLATVDIHSQGGGCTVEVDSEKSDKRKQHLGKTRGKTTKNNGTFSLNFSIYHPMETGLFFGNSEYYINSLKILDDNKAVVTMITSSAISENPRFEFKKLYGKGIYTVIMNDTDGNTFTIKP